MLNEVYGDEVLGNVTIQRWHAAFMKECGSAELIPHVVGPLLSAQKEMWTQFLW